MSQTDLSRVKEDLEVLKQATGIELPFGREDVWVSLLFGFLGVIVAVWIIIPHGLSHRWLAIPSALIFAGSYGVLRYKYRKGTGKPSVRRREYGILPALLMGVFVVWHAKSGADLFQLTATMFFVMGVVLLDTSLKNPVRLYYMGLAIPAMLLSLSYFLWQEPKHVQFSVGVFLIVSGVATAAIQAWQLKRRSVHHDPINFNGLDSTTPGQV